MSYKVIVSLCTLIPTTIENLYSMIKKLEKDTLTTLQETKLKTNGNQTAFCKFQNDILISC